MYHPEEIERVRQAIMRYSELLDLLHADVAAAEKRYAALFAAVPQEQRDSLQEKLLQREAAHLGTKRTRPGCAIHVYAAPVA